MESTGRENWTEKQWAAYRLLKERSEAYEKAQLNRPSLMNQAPKGGWTDADRVPAR